MSRHPDFPETILKDLDQFDPLAGTDPAAYADALDALGDQPLASGDENLLDGQSTPPGRVP